MSRVKNISDNIYFNAVKYNNTNNFILAEYESFRRQIILDDPSLYYLVIEKFYISTQNLFYFIYLDDMSVTIGNSQVFLQYIDVIPTFSFYQAIRFVGQFTQMINNALNTAHINEGAPGLSPEMVFENGIFTLVVDSSYYANNIDIWFNGPLHSKFVNMYHIFYGYGNPLGKDALMIVEPTLINQYTSYPPNINQVSKFTGVPVITLVAQGTGIPLLNEIERLLIYSTLLPTQKEYITLPGDAASDASAAILFEINKINEYNKETSYTKLGDSKLIDLKSNNQITDIDYKVLVETRDGKVYKLFLDPGETMGLSFSFRKKTLYNNQYSFDQRV